MPISGTRGDAFFTEVYRGAGARIDQRIGLRWALLSGEVGGQSLAIESTALKLRSWKWLGQPKFVRLQR